jgi:hypothetical protein
MWTTCAQTVLENSAVAVLLEVRVLNALVGLTSTALASILDNETIDPSPA